MNAPLKAVRDVVRQHSPLPRETVTIDFGDFGELEVEIEIDAERGTNACYDTPATPGWFHIHSVFRNGKDFQPVLREFFGAEAWREFEGVVRGRIERGDA